VPAAVAFAPIEAIGGDTGLVLLQRTLACARLAGPAGRRHRLQAGKAAPATLRVGDTVDFWRVESLEPGRRLRLARRDEIAGPRLLEFEVGAGWRRMHDPADRDLRPRGLGSAAPTGCAVPAARGGVRGDAARDRARGLATRQAVG